MKAGSVRGALVASAVVATAVAAAGCGGSGSAQAPGTTTSTDQTAVASTPDAPAPEIARQIKARLAAGGYAVHTLKVPKTPIRSAADVQTLAQGPQRTLIALTSDEDGNYTRLQNELVAIRTKARARAVANEPMTKAVQQQLVTLSANLRDLSRHELSVIVFNSADDAATYTTALKNQNTHVLSLPGAGDLIEYKAIGSVVYSADVLETEGKVNFDQGAFDKFVALGQGEKSQLH